MTERTHVYPNDRVRRTGDSPARGTVIMLDGFDSHVQAKVHWDATGLESWVDLNDLARVEDRYFR